MGPALPLRVLIRSASSANSAVNLARSRESPPTRVKPPPQLARSPRRVHSLLCAASLRQGSDDAPRLTRRRRFTPAPPRPAPGPPPRLPRFHLVTLSRYHLVTNCPCHRRTEKSRDSPALWRNSWPRHGARVKSTIYPPTKMRYSWYSSAQGLEMCGISDEYQRRWCIRATLAATGTSGTEAGRYGHRQDCRCHTVGGQDAHPTRRVRRPLRR